MTAPQDVRITCSVLLLLFASSMYSLKAQASRNRKATFGLTAIAGINLSQIDGDNYKGFNKVGFIGGLRGIITFNAPVEVRLELLYSQKGSKFERYLQEASGDKPRSITLNYAEIPLIVAWHVNSKRDMPEVWVEAGVSMARLLSSTIRDPDDPAELEFLYSSIEDEFNNTDVSVLFGAAIKPVKWFGVGLRYETSVTRLYDDPEASTGMPVNAESVELLRNYHLSLFGTYHF